MGSPDFFVRQISMFGADGQRAIRQTSVSVIGVGGIGSHVVQQLALLGVGHLSIIDQDRVEESNLNRLIGAGRHTAKGTLKTDVAYNLIQSIDSSITVNRIPNDLRSQEAFHAIMQSNYVFGCVDNDGARLVLTELCSAYAIPYIDLATEVIPGHTLQYGGRVFFTLDSNACLYCYNEISMEEATTILQSSEAKANRQAVYGVAIEHLEGSGPSVVTLNGLIASLATTEFMVHITGIRKPNRFLQFRGNFGIVNNITGSRSFEDCYYCKSLRGIKEKADVERYIRKH